MTEKLQPVETPELETPELATEEKVLEVKVTTPRGLNVRKKPSKAAKILRELRTNDVVSLKNVNDGWGELESGGFILLEFTNYGKE